MLFGCRKDKRSFKMQHCMVKNKSYWNDIYNFPVFARERKQTQTVHWSNGFLFSFLYVIYIMKMLHLRILRMKMHIFYSTIKWHRLIVHFVLWYSMIAQLDSTIVLKQFSYLFIYLLKKLSRFAILTTRMKMKLVFSVLHIKMDNNMNTIHFMNHINNFFNHELYSGSLFNNQTLIQLNYLIFLVVVSQFI